jgi:hypothetical protein
MVNRHTFLQRYRYEFSTGKTSSITFLKYLTVVSTVVVIREVSGFSIHHYHYHSSSGKICFFHRCPIVVSSMTKNDNAINDNSNDDDDVVDMETGRHLRRENLPVSFINSGVDLQNQQPKSSTSTALTTITTTRIGFKVVNIKQSLTSAGTDIIIANNQFWLTAISAGHYSLYPLGLGLAWYLFDNADRLETIMTPIIAATTTTPFYSSSSSSSLSIFLLIIGHLSSAWGSAMSGTIVHECEDWQIAEVYEKEEENYDTMYYNNNNDDNGKVNEEFQSLKDYNNPIIYSVGFTMLSGSISFGNWCVSAAVFGLSPLVVAFGIYTVLLFWLGPDQPKCTDVWPIWMNSLGLRIWWDKVTSGRSVFRVSAWKFHGGFIPNAILCAVALVRLFGQGTSSWSAVLLAQLPLLLSSAGGIWEGLVGETTLDQRHHFVAIVLICCGFSLYFPFYRSLLVMDTF